MKNISRILFLALGATVLTFSACKKDDVETTGNVDLDFSYVWGSNQEDWTLGDTKVHPMSGDTLTFTTLRYYISNIKLRQADGTEWVESESYHLLDADPSVADGSKIELTDIPVGEYTEIEFMIGVDSTRNVSGAQEGALSTTNGMFWSWNSGYIFVKAEGSSSNSSNGNFAYHLGGFSGANNALNTKNLSFGSSVLSVAEGSTPAVHLSVNAAKFWHSTSSSTTAMIHMPGAAAVTMAGDFADGFLFDHIHE